MLSGHNPADSGQTQEKVESPLRKHKRKWCGWLKGRVKPRSNNCCAVSKVKVEFP